MEQRRLAIGVGALLLAGLIAASSGVGFAFVALGAGLALGWLVMRILIGTGLATQRPSSRRFPTIAISVGVAFAAIATSALSAVDPNGPTIFAPAPIAFVAGLILALRFSVLGQGEV